MAVWQSRWKALAAPGGRTVCVCKWGVVTWNLNSSQSWVTAFSKAHGLASGHQPAQQGSGRWTQRWIKQVASVFLLEVWLGWTDPLFLKQNWIIWDTSNLNPGQMQRHFKLLLPFGRSSSQRKEWNRSFRRHGEGRTRTRTRKVRCSSGLNDPARGQDPVDQVQSFTWPRDGKAQIQSKAQKFYSVESVMGLPARDGPGLGLSVAAQANRCCWPVRHTRSKRK